MTEPSFTPTSLSKTQKITAVKGMNDILPDEAPLWLAIERLIHALMTCYAFNNIRTPILEQTQLFVKGTGETTDIVEKEMYSFIDRLNGENLTLRPENTPGVVRAAIEHHLTYDGGKRLYYLGQMFRHERPQKGRYRQFHQLGVECIGFSGPEVDAEVILLAHQLLHDLEVTNVVLELNSLGISSERVAHRDALMVYFKKHIDLLDDDSKRRLATNPLRILDSKNSAMQDLIEAAPKLSDFLGDASRQRFQSVQSLLTACGVTYRVNPRLVRGLDYYCHTVFEFVSHDLGAQATVCGGGRYDGLFEMLGGKPTQGVGWGLGMERLIELVKIQGKFQLNHSPDAYAMVTCVDNTPTMLSLLQTLRAHGVSVQMHAGADGLSSIKSQFKKADASGAQYAIIFGEDELTRGEVTVKALRDGFGKQWTIATSAITDLVNCLKNRE